MKKKSKKLIITVILAVILVLAVFLPIPYYIEVPGSAQNISQYIQVDNQTKKTANQDGTLMLVYIREMHATPLSYAMSFLNSFADRDSAADLYQGSNEKDYQTVQQYYMQDAINEAKYVAFKAAHKKVEHKYLGLYVMSVMPNSSFKGKLHVGDTVESVNGKHFGDSQAYINYIKGLPRGSKIKIGVLSGSKHKTLTGITKRLGDTQQYGIGITLTDRTEVKTPIKVQANMDGIEGPSAGLMMSLQIYDDLTHQNLLHGRKVAGTGTINAQGQVGDIGGADKKVVAASRAGASIFFVPDNPIPPVIKKAYPDLQTNYQEAKKAAKKIHTKMKIVPVRTFNQALEYLEKTK